MEILLIIAGLLGAAFFAGTETAFVSRLYRKTTGLAEWWRNHPEAMLATTLVGTNISIVVATAVATELATKTWGGLGGVYVTFGLSLVSLVLCEALPKSAALRWADAWTRAAAYVLFVLKWVMSPVIAATTAFSRAITSLLERIGAEEAPQPIELMEVLSKPIRGLDEGRLWALYIILRLAGRRVLDLMIPQGKLGRLELGSQAAEAHEMLAKGAPYVLVVDAGEIVGVIDKRIAGAIKPSAPLARENISTLFVPESKDVVEFLLEGAGGGFAPAVVVNEHGEVTGAVGGEPLVARILRTPAATRRKALRFPDTSIVIAAETPIDELEIMAGVTLPKGPYRTVGGMIEEITHSIPPPKTTIDVDKLRFTVLASDKRRIYRLRVTRLP